MNQRLFQYIAISAVLLFSSCTKQELETKYSTQEEQIERFVTSQQDRFRVVRNHGSNRIVIQEGLDENRVLLADSLQYSDSVRFYYAGYIFSNGPGALFATNHEQTAASKNFEITDADFEIEEWLYHKGVWIPGLENGFYGVRTGEYGFIVFSAKYGFGNEALNSIPKLSPLIFEYWIEEVKKND